MPGIGAPERLLEDVAAISRKEWQTMQRVELANLSEEVWRHPAACSADSSVVVVVAEPSAAAYDERPLVVRSRSDSARHQGLASRCVRSSECTVQTSSGCTVHSVYPSHCLTLPALLFLHPAGITTRVSLLLLVDAFPRAQQSGRCRGWLLVWERCGLQVPLCS